MDDVELKPGIYWVGGVDWDLRDFHGYVTQRGSSYNAYLIVDEKIALVDTVKHYLYDEMLTRIKRIVDPAKIDYIISNHVEMDHSGSLPMIKEILPDAPIYCTAKGAEGLRRHFKKDWDLRVVGAGDTLELGKRTLHFTPTPMVHWPDNMVTYVSPDKVLLSNDAFGQHIASSERFDDELDWGLLRHEAGKYYANIVLPYGSQVQKAMEALGGIDIDVIGPSHGIIWRSRIGDLLGEYKKWCTGETEKKAVIVYDTMWKSTALMAHALREGLEEGGVPVTMRSLETNHISDVMADVLTHRAILLGSPTLNSSILPTMGAFLAYLKGLRPQNRIGMAFGSYGWGGQSIGELEKAIEEYGWKKPVEGVKLKYVPDPEDLVTVREAGKTLAASILKD